MTEKTYSTPKGTIHYWTNSFSEGCAKINKLIEELILKS